MHQRDVNESVIEQFRAGGELDGMHRDRLLLLTTTGSHSGRERTAPMMFHREGDHLYVIASNMGAAAHPYWYTNLVHHPRVTVETPDRRFDAEAVTITGDEREMVWSRLVEYAPFFADHQAGIDRQIPIVELVASAS